MKRTILLVSAALAFAACTTDYTPDLTRAEGKVTLSFCSSMPVTKAPITGSGDLTLDHFQVFVFDASGTLEANTGVIHDTDVASSLPSVEISPGVKDIWAVGNAPEDITGNHVVNTLAQFLDIRMDLLDQTGGENLMYSAHIPETVVSEAYTVDLEFDHLACKIIIDEIQRNFVNSDLALVPLSIQRIYLSNVAGDCDFACAEAPEVWYNKKGAVEKTNSIIYYSFGSGGHVLSQGSSYTTSHVFYSFPNPQLEDHYAGNTWSPRRTRLVVECLYNGETCYYPVTLPKAASEKLKRNTVYHIQKLILKRPGSPDPDNPGDTYNPYMEYSFEVIVNGWQDDIPYTEEFS